MARMDLTSVCHYVNVQYMAQIRNEADQLQALDVAEGFHLVFLVALHAAADPATWALKGGGNLRLYFDSLRFSEDIDIDVFVDPTRMRGRVEKAFASATLAKLLASLGSTREYLNPKERTDTKERWTIGLRNPAVPAMVYTQVELSYREYDLQEYVVVEAPKSSAATGHPPVPSPTIGHYVPRGAVIQKIGALRGRRHTQPRDVFDLDHLFRKFPSSPARGLVENSGLDQAVARLLELEFADYRAKVVSFLEPSIRAACDSESYWAEMQLRVAGVLEAMKT